MTLLGSDVPLAEAFDGALVDLDGVAYRGPEPIAYAAPSLVAARDGGMKLVFVTNNASREPEQVAEHLEALDIPASPDEVMTAAQAAAELLASTLDPGSRVLVVGGAGLLTAVRASGFEVVATADEQPAAVVQGFAPDVGWRQLAQAAYAIQRGARHVASNRDLTLPDQHGLAPGNGALVAAVVAATGVEPVSAGKPEPAMFHLAAQRCGSSRPLVIGDRLDTDLAGARAAGMPGLLVLTGVSTARDAVLAAPAERPAFLAADLRGLHEVHPLPQEVDGRWVCRDAWAEVADGALRVGGAGVDRLRAACAAAWVSADAGTPVDPSTVPDLGVQDHEPTGAGR